MRLRMLLCVTLIAGCSHVGGSELTSREALQGERPEKLAVLVDKECDLIGLAQQLKGGWFLIVDEKVIRLNVSLPDRYNNTAVRVRGKLVRNPPRDLNATVSDNVGAPVTVNGLVDFDWGGDLSFEWIAALAPVNEKRQ
jgi:hypothetical protein